MGWVQNDSVRQSVAYVQAYIKKKVINHKFISEKFNENSP